MTNDDHNDDDQEPASIMDRLARLANRSKPQPLDRTWQAIPAGPEEDVEPEMPNQYEESDDDTYSETPTIELQRIKHNPSGIQSEGSADDMQAAIERMRAKRRRKGHRRDD